MQIVLKINFKSLDASQATRLVRILGIQVRQRAFQAFLYPQSVQHAPNFGILHKIGFAFPWLTLKWFIYSTAPPVHFGPQHLKDYSLFNLSTIVCIYF